MIPFDELIFFRGVGIPPTRYTDVYEGDNAHRRYFWMFDTLRCALSVPERGEGYK
jgi:hypothetical protein